MKRKNFYTACFLLLLVLAGKAQQQLPAPATADWFQKTSELIKELEYSFTNTATNDQFKAINKANRLAFTINKNGYSVHNTTQTGNTGDVSFAIKSIAGKSLEGNFVIIKRKADLVYQSANCDIQYINNEKGLRQNFIIKNRPTIDPVLTVTIQVRSALQAKELANDQVIFYPQGNEKDIQLIYDGLKVFDASGNILPAEMDLDAATGILTIETDARDAVFPVTIDPLSRTPEWTTSADGILPGLLTNLQLQVQTLYGLTVAGLGDINGDGFDDVSVSAPSMADVISGTGSLTGVGAVFIYLGSSSGLPTTPSKILQPTTAVDGALFGYSVDAGDITGDGKNDIIIGAPLDRYQTSARALIGTTTVEVTAGKVYMYRSEDLFTAPNPTPFLQMYLQGPNYFSNVLAGLFQSNVTVHSLFGFAVAVTPDINGDSKADIVIGSPSYMGIDLLSAQSGAAFAYYSNNLSTTSPTQLNTPTPTLLGLPLLPLANTTGLLFGYSIDGAGDFNNDGKRDVVVGAPAGVDVSSLGGIFSGQVLGGSAYVFYGNGSGVNSTHGARLQADATGLLSNAANLFGYEVKGAKNASGGKTGNILIGAPDGAVLSNVLNGLRVKAGQVHVFKKKTSGGGIGTFESDQIIASPRSTSILSILSGQTIDLSVLFGASIDNMLDVNCDNIGDIIVGEPLSTNVPLIGANVTGGAAYVYLGKNDGTYEPTPFWDLNVTVSPLLGVNATSLIGYCVAGAGYVKGHTQGVRSLIGGPSNTLDFGAGLLNLGNTIGVLFDFTFDNNGLGKAYSFPYTPCSVNIPLPATLTEFKGQKVNSAVLLNWVSLTEDNLAVYELQKSRDGVNYQTITTVNAKNLTHNEYAYTDQQPYIGMNYYRLKMVDRDSRFSYSNIVTVNFKSMKDINVDISPNPVHNIINVRLTGMEKGTYKMELINAGGQRVMTQTINISQPDQLEVITRGAGMTAGMYWLNVYDMNNKRVGSAKIVMVSN